MNAPELPQVRLAAGDDRKALDEFRCARSARRWDLEVEHLVNAELLDWFLAPNHEDRRLLVFIVDEEIVAVAAHELGEVDEIGAITSPANYLLVVAIATGAQSSTVMVDSEQWPLVRYVLNALFTDIMERPVERPRMVFGLVHKDNERSRRMLYQAGLSSQRQYYDEHGVRVTGYLVARGVLDQTRF